MTDAKATLKWFTVPTLIVVMQIVLDAVDAFDSSVVFGAFSVLSILVLYIWRRRFENALKALMPPDGYPNVETVELEKVSLSDRRFAVWSMMLPFAILLFVQMAIAAVLFLDSSFTRTHIGSVFTIFGVLAISFFQIATFIRYLLVKHSRRWQSILMRHSTRRPAP